MSVHNLQKAGELCRTPKGRQPNTIARESSSCGIEFDTLGDLPKSLEAAVVSLLPHKPYLNSLSDTGATFRFFIGWFSESWNTGERLNWNLLRDIADLRISLDFDVYGPGENGS